MSRYSPSSESIIRQRRSLSPVERLSKSFGGLGISSPRMQDYPNPYYLASPSKPIRKNAWHHECIEWENSAHRILSMFEEFLPFTLDPESPASECRLTLEKLCQELYKRLIKTKDSLEYIELKEKLERTKTKLNAERKENQELRSTIAKFQSEKQKIQSFKEDTETTARLLLKKQSQISQREKSLQEEKIAMEAEMKRNREEIAMKKDQLDKQKLKQAQRESTIEDKLERIEELIKLQQKAVDKKQQLPTNQSTIEDVSDSPNQTIFPRAPQHTAPSFKKTAKKKGDVTQFDGINYLVQVSPNDTTVQTPQYLSEENTELSELVAPDSDDDHKSVSTITLPNGFKHVSDAKTQIFFMPPTPTTKHKKKVKKGNDASKKKKKGAKFNNKRLYK